MIKRNRAPNFTTSEIIKLLQLVDKYAAIIENKKTDAVTSRDKHSAWIAIADEFNSSTIMCPRTVESLIACYKNQKLKVKKKYSNDKMSIKAPSSSLSLSIKEAGPLQNSYFSENNSNEVVVNAVAEMGTDWEKNSQTTNIKPQECEAIYKNLIKKVKREDTDFRKEINRTGGGPPPQSRNDAITEKVKHLMGPSLEGLYTVYGGDADFMCQQQELNPEDQNIEPIDAQLSPIMPKEVSGVEHTHMSPGSSKRLGLLAKKADLALKGLESPEEISVVEHTHMSPGSSKRLGLLKKKADPALKGVESPGKKKKTVDLFTELAQSKLQYFKVKHEIIKEQQIYNRNIKALNIDILNAQLTYEKNKNDNQKKKHELELEILKQNNK